MQKVGNLGELRPSFSPLFVPCVVRVVESWRGENLVFFGHIYKKKITSLSTGLVKQKVKVLQAIVFWYVCYRLANPGGISRTPALPVASSEGRMTDWQSAPSVTTQLV